MAKNWTYKTPGIPDEMFLQSDEVPGPTKEEIRVVTISKARLNQGNTVIDVGCGTGGLTVEAAFQVAPNGKVYAVDEDSEAIKITKMNCEQFNVQSSVSILKGSAPQVFSDLPQADAILVGGSGNLREVLSACEQKLKAGGRIVVNAILLETACKAIDELKKLGFKQIDVTQLFVAKGKQVESGTMMMARNPITIVSAQR
jgi:cobalt-precorrin-6B (C15)-methyltransferase